MLAVAWPRCACTALTLAHWVMSRLAQVSRRSESVFTQRGSRRRPTVPSGTSPQLPDRATDSAPVQVQPELFDPGTGCHDRQTVAQRGGSRL